MLYRKVVRTFASEVDQEDEEMIMLSALSLGATSRKRLHEIMHRPPLQPLRHQGRHRLVPFRKVALER